MYNLLMSQLLGFATGIIITVSFLPYVRDTLMGKTKPERASWFIWTVLGGIAFFSQAAKGASTSLLLPGIQTFFELIIFLLAIKFGVGGFTRRDIIALCVAGLGLLLWYFTKEAAIALFIVIGIDAIGTVLTVIKSYEDPWSETLISWVLFSLSGFVTMFTVGSLNIILLSYPFYIFIANVAVITAIYFGKRRVRKKL